MLVGRRITWTVSHQAKVWRPPTDVYETDDAIVVRVEIAGMKEEDFHIQLSRRTLTISGRRDDHASGSKLAYQQMEIMYGDFQTEVYLPWTIEAEDVEATYQDGFLVVVLPKPKKRRVRVVDVNQAGNC